MTSVPVVGTKASQRAVNRYVGQIAKQGAALPSGGAPVLIGETGIPFDLGGTKAGLDMSLQVLSKVT